MEALKFIDARTNHIQAESVGMAHAKRDPVAHVAVQQAASTEAWPNKSVGSFQAAGEQQVGARRNLTLQTSGSDSTQETAWKYCHARAEALMKIFLSQKTLQSRESATEVALKQVAHSNLATAFSSYMAPRVVPDGAQRKWLITDLRQRVIEECPPSPIPRDKYHFCIEGLGPLCSATAHLSPFHSYIVPQGDLQAIQERYAPY